MSAVVQTGSEEPRSAGGTKVIIAAFSARMILGAASAVAPASVDFRNSRLFMRAFLPFRSREGRYRPPLQTLPAEPFHVFRVGRVIGRRILGDPATIPHQIMDGRLGRPLGRGVRFRRFDDMAAALPRALLGPGPAAPPRTL